MRLRHPLGSGAVSRALQEQGSGPSLREQLCRELARIPAGDGQIPTALRCLGASWHRGPLPGWAALHFVPHLPCSVLATLSESLLCRSLMGKLG